MPDPRRETPDPAEGEVDRLLTSLSPPSAAERGNDVEWARIQRELQGRSRARRAVPALAAAAAAIVLGNLVVFGVLRDRGPAQPEWTGVKGAAAVAPARLRVAVVEQGEVRPVASGDAVPREGALAFRIEASGPAALALVRVEGASGEVLFAGRTDGPGVIEVKQDGAPAVYPLAQARGVLRLALVASAEPLSAEDALAAARAGSAGAGAAASEGGAGGVRVDVVAVEVR